MPRQATAIRKPASPANRRSQGFAGLLKPIDGSPELPAADNAKPQAMSTDPDFTKLTCYVRKGTLLAVKRKLLDQGGGHVSDVIESLLRDWSKPAA